MNSEKRGVLRRAAVIGAAAVVAVGLLTAFVRKPWARPAGRVVRIAYVGSLAGGSPTSTGNTSSLPSLTGAPALVVEDGWLERELAKRNARLEWVPMPNANVGPMTNEAFANHSIDFAGYGELPSIIANAAGVHTKLIVPSGRGSDAYLVVPPDSTAKSIADLKGQRIAIHRGRPWELPFARLVDSAGLTYADFTVLNLNPEAGAAALAARKVDALCTTSSAFILVDKGVGKILWSTADAPLDWKMLGGLWAAADFVDRHPDLTQLVATAYVKASAWESKDENREAMIQSATRNGTPASVVRREYETGSWRERWSPLFAAPVLSHYQKAIAYAADKRMIDHTFDFRDCYDDRFVLAAIDDLGLRGYWLGR
ncbi:MAG: ABC transporter substrate-binding protein [Polyangiaceae bacterium]